jgi:hypothetical protein
LRNTTICRFQTFAVICILYMFFWVFPRRQFVVVVGRRFGTLCQFHLQRLVVDCLQSTTSLWSLLCLLSQSTTSLWRWNWHRVPKRRPTTTTNWRRGNTQKNIYNIQITAKVWNLLYYMHITNCSKWNAELVIFMWVSNCLWCCLLLSCVTGCNLQHCQEHFATWTVRKGKSSLTCIKADVWDRHKSSLTGTKVDMWDRTIVTDWY